MLSNWVWLTALVLLLPFAVVPFFGAPYVPTKHRKLIEFIKSLKLPKGTTLLDIGSGDGAVLIATAKQCGFKTYGIELNMILVIIARIRIWLSRVDGHVLYGNMWARQWPEVDVVYAFVMPKFMPQLAEKLEREITKPTMLITYSFAIPGKEPFAQHEGFLAYNFVPLAKK